MAANAVLLLLLAVLATSSTRAAHDLSQEYRFARSLTDDDQYWLHWSIDTEKDTISLAVNVSTTGWVGFGISPNGQMPNSDVVIGWVNDVGNQFQVQSIAIIIIAHHHIQDSPRSLHNTIWTLLG